MIYLLIWLLCGFAAAAIYSNKGRSGFAAFLVGILLGPIGVLLALLTPTDAKGVEKSKIRSGELKKCPYCAELIRKEATVCKHCQREQPEQAAPPPGHARIRKAAVGYACTGCGGAVRSDATSCKHCSRPFEQVA